MYVCTSLFNHTFYNQIKQTQNAIRRCRQTVHHNNNALLKCCLQANTHWWALNMTRMKNTELADKNSLTFFKGPSPFEQTSAAEAKRCWAWPTQKHWKQAGYLPDLQQCLCPFSGLSSVSAPSGTECTLLPLQPAIKHTHNNTLNPTLSQLQSQID